MTRRPFMRFFTDNWRSDPALRMCAPTSRALWIDMLCIMHEADPYGHLLVKGRQVSVEDLAKLSGMTVEETRIAFEELGEKGVYSTKRNGVVFSRKMERDEIKASKNRDNGAKGGNPNLTTRRVSATLADTVSNGNPTKNTQSDNRLDNRRDNQGHNRQDIREDKAHGESIFHIPEREEEDLQRQLSTTRARDPAAAAPPSPEFHDRVLKAAGIDVSKDTSGRWLSSTQTWAARRWLTDLGLTEAEVVVVLTDVTRRRKNGPPASLAYFDGAMAEAAGRKAEDPLKPITAAPTEAKRDPELEWFRKLSKPTPDQED